MKGRPYRQQVSINVNVGFEINLVRYIMHYLESFIYLLI